MPDRLKRQRWAARRANGLCGECGVVPSVRYARCDFCRAIVNEQRTKRYRQNKTKGRAIRRAEYRRNPELYRAAARQWYADNRDKELARLRRRYQEMKQRAA